VSFSSIQTVIKVQLILVLI